MNEATMQLGLLMEAAHGHQALAEASLDKLQAHVRDLDLVVREQIRCSFIDELQLLSADSRRAAEALRALRRAANARVMLWGLGVVVPCLAMVLGTAWWVLPSQAEIARLRAQRDQLSAAVLHLERHGGRIDLRRCGEAGRLCVRVDLKAPAYGERADYLIVKGY